MNSAAAYRQYLQDLEEKRGWCSLRGVLLNSVDRREKGAGGSPADGCLKSLIFCYQPLGRSRRDPLRKVTLAALEWRVVERH